MKSTKIYFLGIMLLLLSCAALYFTGALFDTAGNRYIEAFIMQPNNLSGERIGRPVQIEQLSEKFIRERLIRKFMHEYFHVNPDTENVTARMRGDSVMAALSYPAVFGEWKRTEGANIEKLAAKKNMRTVSIADEILKKGEYWEVAYTLYTWDAPNNMELAPTADTGIMHIKFDFEKGVREQRNGRSFDAREYLQSGGDPAAIFKFRVGEVKR